MAGKKFGLDVKNFFFHFRNLKLSFFLLCVCILLLKYIYGLFFNLDVGKNRILKEVKYLALIDTQPGSRNKYPELIFNFFMLKIPGQFFPGFPGFQPVVLPSYFSQFAVMGLQIDFNTTGSQKKKLGGHFVQIRNLSNFFSSKVVLLTFISRYAPVRQQIDSHTTGLQKKI